MLEAPRNGRVAAEIPRPVQAQVDPQHQAVVEVQKQLLAVRAGGQQRGPVEPAGAGGEAALRAGDGKPRAGENVLELAGQAVDRVAFRHLAGTSPVVS